MIELKQNHSALITEIKKRAGANFSICMQCRTCANACPFVEAMDYPPNVLLRMVQMGMKNQVLESSSIWVCVGCNTCCSYCPMAVDIPAMMDSLREKALEDGVKIAEPEILGFHKVFLDTVKKYGRSHKLEMMMRYKINQRDFFSDVGMGLTMLKKGKLDIVPSKIKDRSALDKIFNK